MRFMLVGRQEKKLLDAVIKTRDFPIVLETWRTCLRDEFDLENMKRLLDELSEGSIKITRTRTTSASPFATGLIWQQTNQHMSVALISRLSTPGDSQIWTSHSWMKS
mgnify:CR=1 FL=1